LDAPDRFGDTASFVEMIPIQLDPSQIATLEALADGIIPADARDGGASAVQSGLRLTERIEKGTHSALYLDGIAAAVALARERFQRDVPELKAIERHELIGHLKERLRLSSSSSGWMCAGSTWAIPRSGSALVFPVPPRRLAVIRISISRRVKFISTTRYL
jgi:hypothetical protein